MNALTSGMVGRLQEIQEGHMMDSCKILAYSATEDEYNQKVPAFTAGTEIICGVNFTRSREIQQEAEVIKTDGVIRLPIDTAVTGRDRIRITKRFGVAVDEVDYEIIGDPRRGPSGLLADVVQVVE